MSAFPPNRLSAREIMKVAFSIDCGGTLAKATWSAYATKVWFLPNQMFDSVPRCRRPMRAGHLAFPGVLGLRRQVWFIGIEVDRHGDVLMDDEPVPVDLAIDVGDPHGEVDLLALLIRSNDVLD
jgi:hypothetical protein